LQEAAFSIEQSLQGEPPVCRAAQLDVLEKELSAALLEFEPVVKEAEAENKKTETAQITEAELSALLSELRPLLEAGDFRAADFAEKLQSIAGMEKLAERIDDYDFEGALAILNQ
jgi:hypothetical protein